MCNGPRPAQQPRHPLLAPSRPRTRGARRHGAGGRGASGPGRRQRDPRQCSGRRSARQHRSARMATARLSAGPTSSETLGRADLRLRRDELPEQRCGLSLASPWELASCARESRRRLSGAGCLPVTMCTRAASRTATCKCTRRRIQQRRVKQHTARSRQQAVALTGPQSTHARTHAQHPCAAAAPAAGSATSAPRPNRAAGDAAERTSESRAGSPLSVPAHMLVGPSCRRVVHALSLLTCSATMPPVA